MLLTLTDILALQYEIIGKIGCRHEHTSHSAVAAAAAAGEVVTSQAFVSRAPFSQRRRKFPAGACCILCSG